MSLTEKTNDGAEAVALLTQQFKDKRLVRKLLRSWVKPLQEIEAVAFDLLEARDIDLAVGVQLDLLGTLVGASRGAYGDAVYREQIKTQILVNKSNGTVPEILTIFARIVPDLSVVFTQLAGAAFTIQTFGVTDSDTADFLAAVLAKIKAAGVGSLLTVDQYEVPFAMSGDDDEGDGFDVGQFAGSA